MFHLIPNTKRSYLNPTTSLYLNLQLFETQPRKTSFSTNVDSPKSALSRPRNSRKSNFEKPPSPEDISNLLLPETTPIYDANLALTRFQDASTPSEIAEHLRGASPLHAAFGRKSWQSESRVSDGPRSSGMVPRGERTRNGWSDGFGGIDGFERSSRLAQLN